VLLVSEELFGRIDLEGLEQATLERFLDALCGDKRSFHQDLPSLHCRRRGGQEEP
jgi:hypothetical protein